MFALLTMARLHIAIDGGIAYHLATSVNNPLIRDVRRRYDRVTCVIVLLMMRENS